MDPSFSNGKLEQLKQVLSSHTPGKCPVVIEFTNGHASARLRLADEWQVGISDTMLEQFQTQFGDGVASIEYP